MEGEAGRGIAAEGLEALDPLDSDSFEEEILPDSSSEEDEEDGGGEDGEGTSSSCDDMDAAEGDDPAECWREVGLVCPGRSRA